MRPHQDPSCRDGEEPATHRSACMASIGLWRLLPFTVASALTFCLLAIRFLILASFAAAWTTGSPGRGGRWVEG